MLRERADRARRLVKKKGKGSKIGASIFKPRIRFDDQDVEGNSKEVIISVTMNFTGSEGMADVVVTLASAGEDNKSCTLG